MREKNKIDFHESSGNVFADVGYPNPEEALAKSNLAKQIYKVIKSRKLIQKQAAEILGIDQPRVSDIIRGNLAKYSLDRLMRFLRILGKDIEIRIKKSKRMKRPRLDVIEEKNSKAIKRPKSKVGRKKRGIKI